MGDKSVATATALTTLGMRKNSGFSIGWSQSAYLNVVRVLLSLKIDLSHTAMVVYGDGCGDVFLKTLVACDQLNVPFLADVHGIVLLL